MRQLQIGALVLAAGFSHRFGAAKLTAAMADDRPLIEHTLSNISAAFENILIVSRPGAAAASAFGDLPLLLFEGAGQGMGASLAHGISRLPAWDACMVCLADMPFIQAQTYQVLAREMTRQNIVIPCHNGRQGNPVGFGRRFFAELTQLQGDRGGRKIIREHKDSIREININDPAILIDIDTPEDLRRRDN